MTRWLSPPSPRDQFRTKLISKICGFSEIETLDSAELEAFFQALATAGQFWRGAFNLPLAPAAQRDEIQRVSEGATALEQAIAQLSQASKIWIDDCLHRVVDLDRLAHELAALSKSAQHVTSAISVKQGHQFAAFERLLGVSLENVHRRHHLPLRIARNVDVATDRNGFPLLSSSSTLASCSALLVLLDAQYRTLSWSAANRMVKYAISCEKALKETAFPPELIAFAKGLMPGNIGYPGHDDDALG